MAVIKIQISNDGKYCGNCALLLTRCPFNWALDKRIQQEDDYGYLRLLECLAAEVTE